MKEPKLNTKRFFIELIKNRGNCPNSSEPCMDCLVYAHYAKIYGEEENGIMYGEGGCFPMDSYNYALLIVESKFPIDFLKIHLEKL
ncbi:MAG TPA: hypothetical protein P5136_01565 [Methanofastidiosum sp.]|nr:hypothetical protein [Methanofastidiosum sp.]